MRGFFRVMFEAVMPFRVIEGHWEDRVAGKHQSISAGPYPDDAVAGRVTACRGYGNIRRRFGLVLEGADMAVVDIYHDLFDCCRKIVQDSCCRCRNAPATA